MVCPLVCLSVHWSICLIVYSFPCVYSWVSFILLIWFRSLIEENYHDGLGPQFQTHKAATTKFA